jgi:NADH-quinone oxidoreductase subunit J
LERALVYGAYAVAGLVAIAVYAGLPKQERPPRALPVVLISALALGGLVLLAGRLVGDAADRLYFCLLSLLAVFAAIRVVTHPRPVYSALYFILVVLSTAGLMVLAGAEFLAVALVIIYAGAILVTYVFVIMMAQPSSAGRFGRWARAVDYDRSAREPAAAVVAGFVLMATIAGVIAGRQWPGPSQMAAPAAENANTLALGRLLLTEGGFPISVQLAGLLLTIAMIGAIAIARKRLPRAEHENEAPAPGEIGKRVKPF